MGLSEVARACKCSVQFISNIEHGRAPLPWDKAEQLARVLNITSADLHAANMAVRSDFKSFLGTSAQASGNGAARARTVKKNATALKDLTDSASLVAQTAKDPGLRELLQLLAAVPQADRKKFYQKARTLLA
jgi:transcriptional regulator with XRE-family HTH domain